jgi:hypothetical protein
MGVRKDVRIMAEIKFPTIRIEADDMDRLDAIVNKFQDTVSKLGACIWSYGDEYWSTSCGQEFVMIEGTPKENGYNFCPSCGKPLVELTTM